jgi:hypothetical protein
VTDFIQINQQMTKQQITDIFNLFKALKEQDDKTQETFTAFCETVS